MKAINAYKATTVTTANRFDLVVMLYDGFLSFAKAAGEAMRTGDRARAGSQIGQAMGVLHELNATLDHSANPEFTSSLASLYNYLDHTMLKANIEQDPSKVDSAAAIMSDLREAWAQAAKQLNSEPRSPQCSR